MRQSDEKAEFYHFSGAVIKLRQPAQRFVQARGRRVKSGPVAKTKPVA